VILATVIVTYGIISIRNKKSTPNVVPVVVRPDTTTCSKLDTPVVTSTTLTGFVQVDITCNPVVGADYYIVYLGAVQGFDPLTTTTTVGQSTTTTVTFLTLPLGTPFYYKMQAVSRKCGVSDFSLEGNFETPR
jgi:hypothetical protein